jgi:TRAP-type C4-dicarboxylate transport system permease small subunit
LKNRHSQTHWVPPIAFWPPWQEGRLDPLARGMSNIAGYALFIMMIIMTLHVLGRKIGMPVPGAFEASEQLMVIVFAFPLADIGLRKGQIAFELITRFFPEKVKGSLEVLNHLAGMILFGPLTVKAWQIAGKMFSIKEYRQGIIDFPIWPFRVLIAFGLTVFCFQMAVGFTHALRKKLKKR